MREPRNGRVVGELRLDLARRVCRAHALRSHLAIERALEKLVARLVDRRHPIRGGAQDGLRRAHRALCRVREAVQCRGSPAPVVGVNPALFREVRVAQRLLVGASHLHVRCQFDRVHKRRSKRPRPLVHQTEDRLHGLSPAALKRPEEVLTDGAGQLVLHDVAVQDASVDHLLRECRPLVRRGEPVPDLVGVVDPIGGVQERDPCHRREHERARDEVARLRRRGVDRAPPLPLSDRLHEPPARLLDEALRRLQLVVDVLRDVLVGHLAVRRRVVFDILPPAVCCRGFGQVTNAGALAPRHFDAALNQPLLARPSVLLRDVVPDRAHLDIEDEPARSRDLLPKVRAHAVLVDAPVHADPLVAHRGLLVLREVGQEHGRVRVLRPKKRPVRLFRPVRELGHPSVDAGLGVLRHLHVAHVRAALHALVERLREIDGPQRRVVAGKPKLSREHPQVVHDHGEVAPVLVRDLKLGVEACYLVCRGDSLWRARRFRGNSLEFGDVVKALLRDDPSLAGAVVGRPVPRRAVGVVPIEVAGTPPTALALRVFHPHPVANGGLVLVGNVPHRLFETLRERPRAPRVLRHEVGQRLRNPRVLRPQRVP